MLGLTTVLNSIKALIDDWDIVLLDDKGLLDKPICEHILVGTISRPRNDVLCRLSPRKAKHEAVAVRVAAATA